MALTEQLRLAMVDKMKPAYDRLSAWVAEDKKNASATPQGAGSLPNGEAYYNAMLNLMTTTDMTADEIHQLGLSEVARIQGEMEKVKEEAGFKGTLQEFFAFMRTDKQFYLPNNDAGAQQYIDLATKHIEEMKLALPKYFGRLPKADLIVKRVEPFREEPGGAQHYQSGTPDGSRPGIYYAHLSDMNAMPTYMLEDIAYHEGLPGHHMQISIQQELEAETGPDKLPKFRTQYGYTAYSEGWGLYSEALSQGDGLPEGSLQPLRPALGRDLARDPACGRYGHPLQGLDRGAGGEVLHRELVHRGGRDRVRSAPLHHDGGAGDGLQDRHDPAAADARQGADGAGRQVQLSRLSTTRSSAAARCRCRCWSGRSIAGSQRRRRLEARFR